jgi:choline dehydrogenase-like flavoprotein
VRRTLPLALLLALAGAGSLHASVGSAQCTAGPTTVGGQSARAFCGPAKAKVEFGSRTFAFSQGSCLKTSKYVAVNIGTVVLGQTKAKKPDYFGLSVGSFAGAGKAAGGDGKYAGGVVALEFGGKGYLVDGRTLKTTLTHGRSRGTFTATSLLISPAVKVSGSFSC